MRSLCPRGGLTIWLMSWKRKLLLSSAILSGSSISSIWPRRRQLVLHYIWLASLCLVFSFSTWYRSVVFIVFCCSRPFVGSPVRPFACSLHCLSIPSLGLRTFDCMNPRTRCHALNGTRRNLHLQRDINTINVKSAACVDEIDPDGETWHFRHLLQCFVSYSESIIKANNASEGGRCGHVTAIMGNKHMRSQ